MKRTVNKINRCLKTLAPIMALLLCALPLTACGKSVFGLSENTAKRVTITAELTDGEETAGAVPAGSYLLRATCVEKASGTVVVELRAA